MWMDFSTTSWETWALHLYWGAGNLTRQHWSHWTLTLSTKISYPAVYFSSVDASAVLEEHLSVLISTHVQEWAWASNHHHLLHHHQTLAWVKDGPEVMKKIITKPYHLQSWLQRVLKQSRFLTAVKIQKPIVIKLSTRTSAHKLAEIIFCES